MEKIIRAFWYVSVLVVFGGMMYSFAGLPEEVQLLEGLDPFSKDIYFYIILAIIALSNFLIYSVSYRFAKRKQVNAVVSVLPTWLGSLNFTLNLFYFVGLMYVMMYNSNEKWDYQLLGYGVMVSIGLITVSLFSLPFLILYNKQNKQS